MSEVDSSAAPSVRARLAELKLQQQPVQRRPPPPPPPALPPRKKPPPLPQRKGDGVKPSLPPRRATTQPQSPQPIPRAIPVRTNTAPARVVPPVPAILPVKAAPRKLPPRVIPPIPSRASETPSPAKATSPPPLPGRPQHSGTSSSRSIPLPPPRPSLPPIPLLTRPPPVPASTRPTVSTCLSASTATCLRHRSFAAADAHAALPHPIDTLFSLAQSLTSPFPSATDKARVIFVYLHHHISYDFSGFLGDTPMGKQDALSVLRTGKSVCQGYAELFLALAKHSGLEAVLASGHGKGYGYAAGSQIPWPPTGHAWNAVRIDAGEWWLIDACWGAGTVSKETGYTPGFNESHFVSTPAEFGRRHFPADAKWLLTSQTWEEYCTHREDEIPKPIVYAGFSEMGFMDKAGSIAPVVARIEADGQYEVVIVKGPCECLPYEGREEEERLLFVRVGCDEEMKVMKRDGRRWKAVVQVRAGQRVAIEYILTWEGRDGSSIDASTFERGIGKVGWSWSVLVEWKGEE
ncbi:hypothetical protein K440DRAFT_646234 [Wilcoxina mikolae CBS 423.85]|nr:hypothetical protein K440DRAFT_646234 [Wilcoxina mikolae CBS 423.85]